jgi:alkylhydroperoxidase/carboxymuconolactone decarboxylase family protein YurZ
MTYTPVPDTPVASTLVAMTSESLDRCDLADREVMIARLAALAASGAPAISYTFNAAAAAMTGLTEDDAKSILVAIAPVIGTSRTVAAAQAIAEGLGIMIALLEEAAEEG